MHFLLNSRNKYNMPFNFPGINHILPFSTIYYHIDVTVSFYHSVLQWSNLHCTEATIIILPLSIQ